ncbi:MAG: ABC transporter permease [Lachnospiraceae bacterium]|nr:ABC transporter permease [Lachnospiraceae bacterium]MBQ6995730.1 ABC transporter permease [Lachnospiraceae bacterium]
MSKYVSLTRRNCMVFLRDTTAVFFSLLSMLMVLLMMWVFLGDMNTQGIINVLEQYGGERNVVQDKENALNLVQYWTLAGLMVVNALTVTLSVIGLMVGDANENKLQSFFSAPVNRSVIALSYITTAVIVGMLFCMITLGVALGYIWMTGGAMLSMGAIVQIFGYTLMNVCIFAIIMYMLGLFVKSSSAWGGIATVVGTLVGFVGAIYLPMGDLPAGVANMLKYIPILHGTSLMRKVCCKEAMETTFAGIPKEVLDAYQEHMGITVCMDGVEVSDGAQILFLCMCGVLAFLLIAFLTKRKNISDR